MSAVPVRHARLLKVMGVTPWRLRAGEVAARSIDAVEGEGPATTGERATCVVILPSGCTERERDIVGHALRAFGAVTARAARLEVGAAGLMHVPLAATYLVFGDAQARALGHQLSAAQQGAAQIVLVDTPSLILTDAAAKRRLWNGLRALGRAFARS
ncbi:hypothetical protein [Xanthomonas sp. NCPPB 2632]|uniref:hypothetical protein n=1 Tax=Xanthomonas sp. NCPPB 2632 TaxID=3240912 RepID=UPI0035157D12